jgi:hypothetical protein
MARSLCGVPGLINGGSAHSRTGSETTEDQGSKHQRRTWSPLIQSLSALISGPCGLESMPGMPASLSTLPSTPTSTSLVKRCVSAAPREGGVRAADLHFAPITATVSIPIPNALRCSSTACCESMPLSESETAQALSESFPAASQWSTPSAATQALAVRPPRRHRAGKTPHRIFIYIPTLAPRQQNAAPFTKIITPPRPTRQTTAACAGGFSAPPQPTTASSRCSPAPPSRHQPRRVGARGWRRSAPPRRRCLS